MWQSTDFTREFEIPVPSNFEHRPRCSYIELLASIESRYGMYLTEEVLHHRRSAMRRNLNDDDHIPICGKQLNEKELSELSD